jgi:hypothetical protein
VNAPAKIEVGIASPSYCAEMRRAQAKRIAREECQRTIAAAYVALGNAEGAADRAYLAEMEAISADLCAAWSDRRKVA